MPPSITGADHADISVQAPARWRSGAFELGSGDGATKSACDSAADDKRRAAQDLTP